MCCRNSKHLWTYLSLKSVSCLKNAQRSVYAKEGEKTVRYWVMNEKRKKHIHKTGEDPIETVILDNESTDNDEVDVRYMWRYESLGILELSSNSSICSASAVCRYFYIFFLGWCGVIRLDRGWNGRHNAWNKWQNVSHYDNKVTVIMWADFIKVVVISLPQIEIILVRHK